MILYSITVNAWQPPYGRLRVIQEEANGREIAVTVTGADGQPINFTGKTVSVYLEKPDGTKIYNTCAVSGSTVTIPLSAQMTAVYGISNLFELHIVDAESHTLKVTLPPLCIIPSNYDGAIESSNEFSALSEALANVANMQAQINKMEQNMQHKALPNLLVNPEFGVNQRGKESYTASSTQYTYDRWLAAHTTVTREANTSPAPVLYMAKCVFQNTNWPNFGQTLENYSQYVGKTLTVRFWIKGLPRTSSVTLWVGNSGHVIPLTGDWQEVTHTFDPVTDSTVSFSRKGLLLQASAVNPTAGTGFWLAAPQVCVGAYTGDYAPPNPAAEYLKCCRYYWNMNPDNIQGFAVGLGTTRNVSQNYVYVPLQFPTPMRATPEVSIAGSLMDAVTGNPVTEVAMIQYSGGIGRLRFALQNTAVQGNVFDISGASSSGNNLTFDAEIYS